MMDGSHFDDLIHSLTQTRRTVLGGGLLTAAGWLGMANVEAKKKHKHKKAKLERNEFGCVDVGGACQGNSANCCSGLCEGKKPKKGKKDTSTCVEHDARICTPQFDSCAAGVSVSCHPNNESCYCVMTTGNAGFCGDFTGGGEGPAALCQVCTQDSDCQAQAGPGAACVLLDESCTAICAATGRTACVPACRDAAP